MGKEYLSILESEVEIPEVFQEKVDNVLMEIRKSSKVKRLPIKKQQEQEKLRKQEKLQKRREAGWIKVAAIIMVCLLIPGVTVAAGSMLNAYWQRMADMDEAAVEEFYDIGSHGETITYNRDLTDDEMARLGALREKYVQEGVFPENEIKRFHEPEIYQGDGIALNEDRLQVYLPDRALTDDELLQIIDLDEKMVYSVREKNQIGYGKAWRERMDEMTMEEVDEIYFTLYSNQCDLCGGYSRTLTAEEQARYEELQKEYEEEGKYTEAECTIIMNVADCTGEGLAICIQDGDYHLPERELTDEELLLIIDWQHKGAYCLERIGNEVDMGIRAGFPKSPYDVEPYMCPTCK